MLHSMLENTSLHTQISTDTPQTALYVLKSTGKVFGSKVVLLGLGPFAKMIVKLAGFSFQELLPYISNILGPISTPKESKNSSKLSKTESCSHLH